MKTILALILFVGVNCLAADLFFADQNGYLNYKGKIVKASLGSNREGAYLMVATEDRRCAVLTKDLQNIPVNEIIKAIGEDLVDVICFKDSNKRVIGIRFEFKTK